MHGPSQHGRDVRPGPGRVALLGVLIHAHTCAAQVPAVSGLYCAVLMELFSQVTVEVLHAQMHTAACMLPICALVVVDSHLTWNAHQRAARRYVTSVIQDTCSQCSCDIILQHALFVST